MRKRWFQIGVALVLCTAVGCGDDRKGKLPPPANKQYQEALAQAKAEGKDVFVEFSTSDCVYCRKMKHDTFENPQVQTRLAQYVMLPVDAHRERDLAEYFGVSGYPTYFVVTADGRARKRDAGYKSPSEFLAWLDRN